MTSSTTTRAKEIDAFVRSLAYDPRLLLAVQPDGATESFVPTDTDRVPSGNEVIITTKKRHTLTKNLSDVAILRPTGGVIYPGALILGDVNLMEGQPTPIALPRGAVTISVDLPGLVRSTRVVEQPTNSSVQDAITSLLDEWTRAPSDDGYINVARSYIEVQTIYSSMQAALSLGFSAKWSNGAASAQLNASTSSESSTVLAYYKQVFYTVTMDTPPSASSVFDDSVTVDDLRGVISAEHPPAYVRSVDYGRILMIKMETTSSASKVELQAALKQVTSSAEVEGSVSGKYESLVRNAKFTVVAIGGGAQTAAQFSGEEEDLKRMRTYIQTDARFRRDNPGAPIAYNVAFLKDHVLATMGFTTDYTETESIRYPNGYVKVKNSGAYVGRFTITWEEPDAKGVYSAKSWASGNKTAGYSQQIDLPGDARNVKILGEAKTGLVWDPWGEALNVTIKGPNNLCYRIKGTTLNRSWDNNC